MVTKIKVLVVEDIEVFRQNIVKHVSRHANPIAVSNFEEAKRALLEQHFDMALIDINLNGEDTGFELLKLAKRKNIFSVVLTNYDDSDYIATAYKLGCNLFLTKDQCEVVIEHVIKGRISEELAKAATPNATFEQMDIFKENYISINKLITTEINLLKARMFDKRPIFLIGETGVGKNLLGQLIHQSLYPNNNNYTVFKCSQYSEKDVDSTLFGKITGIENGVVAYDKGLLELAQNGTLYIEEIGALSLSVQKKLAKALEEKCFIPQGASEYNAITPISIDFQLIASTSDNIYKKIEENLFLASLLQRIHTITLEIPPLRKRIEDVKLLIEHYFRNGIDGTDINNISLGSSAIEALCRYDFPGNVKELKTILLSLSLKKFGNLSVEDLPKSLLHVYRIYTSFNDSSRFATDDQVKYIKKVGFRKFVDKLESEVVKDFIKKHGHAEKAYKELRINRHKYYKIIRMLGEEAKLS
ncbi:MAG: sigma-54-dependent Fis family transcriptional regulator [Oligoflexia bacterium]|nr:sigma-54-dependent Fis family transcriptional regulator [Oligoflexia bacterium]MBF0365200.1 sigma-54-dependent Fis family transcriptional regulator [Oligoflexia bacterium]